MLKNFVRNFCAISAAIAAIFFFAFASAQSDTLELTFLDVGQGDAILIRTPTNEKVLIDAGPAGAILAPLAAELNFWEREIDLAILTHPDTDHIAGMVELLKRYKIKRIMLTGVQHETDWYTTILREITRQKIPVILGNATTDLELGGGARLDILWPEEILAGKFIEDTNTTSIATRLIFGETAAVLTGDLDLASEKLLLEDASDLHAQILKLGHHGSKNSSSAEFLAAVAPEIAIVSASADNSFGHPNPEVLAKLPNAETLETSKSGSIKFSSDGVRWRSDQIEE